MGSNPKHLLGEFKVARAVLGQDVVTVIRHLREEGNWEFLCPASARLEVDHGNVSFLPLFLGSKLHGQISSSRFQMLVGVKKGTVSFFSDVLSSKGRLDMSKFFSVELTAQTDTFREQLEGRFPVYSHENDDGELDTNQLISLAQPLPEVWGDAADLFKDLQRAVARSLRNVGLRTAVPGLDVWQNHITIASNLLDEDFRFAPLIDATFPSFTRLNLDGSENVILTRFGEVGGYRTKLTVRAKLWKFSIMLEPDEANELAVEIRAAIKASRR